MKKFHHVYIEITNICNLDCSFCAKTSREKGFMSMELFKKIIDEVSPYTNNVYFHVLGEPLLHPQLDAFLAYTKQKNMTVFLTTNGTLLQEKFDILHKYDHIKKYHISIHAMNDIAHQHLDTNHYMQNVCSFADQILQHYNTTIVYRLWHEHYQPLLAYLNQHYQTQIPYEKAINGIEVKNHVRIHFGESFVWPIHGKNPSTNGFCYALRSHIAILMDGTICPCCLDNNGINALGNIEKQPLSQILESSITQNFYRQFTDRKIQNPLCIQCEYKKRFDS